MRRREFISLLYSAAVGWPVVARAQQASLPVVGFLNSASAQGYASMAASFKQGLMKRSRSWNCLSLAPARPRSISCRRFIAAPDSRLFEGCVLQWLRSSMSIQS